MKIKINIYFINFRFIAFPVKMTFLETYPTASLSQEQLVMFQLFNPAASIWNFVWYL